MYSNLKYIFKKKKKQKKTLLKFVYFHLSRNHGNTEFFLIQSLNFEYTKNEHLKKSFY